VLSSSGFSLDEWVKWLMLVALIGFLAIFFGITYCILRWVKYKQLGDKYTPPLPSALESPQTELEDLKYLPCSALGLCAIFNISY